MRLPAYRSYLTFKMETGLTQEEITRRLAAALETASDSLDHRFSLPADLWNEDPKEAAVLIPLLRREDAWHVLFTRRTANLVEHSGQVAFPGGRADPGDQSPEETALREAHEEIHLHPGDVQVLGRLNKMRTISNYKVTPVIGAIPWPYSFQLALDEVSKVFTIPLDWLADPGNHEVRLRDLPPPHSPAPVIYFHLYEDELLWGISAQLTLDLLRALRLR